MRGEEDADITVMSPDLQAVVSAECPRDLIFCSSKIQHGRSPQTQWWAVTSNVIT